MLSVLTAVIVLVSSSFATPVFSQGNMTDVDGISLPDPCAIGAPVEMPPIVRFREPILVFVYEERPGLAIDIFKRMSYDSLSKQLVSFGLTSSPEIERLSSQQQRCLERVIQGSAFFEAKTDYPPVQNATELLSYSLAIIWNNRTHTVTWTDASEGVPTGIFEIVKEIKELT